MSQAPMSSDVSSDDKLWSALCYIPYVNPIISIICLLMEEKKTRPFIKYHAVQSLVLGIIAYVLTPVCGIGLLVAIYMLYLAYQSYQGKYEIVPVMTEFIKNQGWV
jgi:uncharacterized membrane protein